VFHKIAFKRLITGQLYLGLIIVGLILKIECLQTVVSESHKSRHCRVSKSHKAEFSESAKVATF